MSLLNWNCNIVRKVFSLKGALINAYFSFFNTFFKLLVKNLNDTLIVILGIDLLLVFL